MRHEQLPVEWNRGPADLVHQRAVERGALRLAFFAELRDFFVRDAAGVIVFHAGNAFPRRDGFTAEFLVRGKKRGAFQHDFVSHRKHGFGRGQKKK